MLPPGIRWQSVIPGNAGAEDSLAVDYQPVARLHERLNGTWFATLRLPDGRRLTRDCSSREAGKRGCEQWALRHEAELRAWAEQVELRWLSKQAWRGGDKIRAMARLRELGDSFRAGGQPAI